MLTEKQLTRRATQMPIEYNYTNLDAKTTNPEPHDGYTFDYPLNWTSDASSSKVIGLRRLNYRPCSVNLNYDLEVAYFVSDSKGNTVEETQNLYNMTAVFTSDNSFEEAINKIGDDIYNVSGKVETTEGIAAPKCKIVMWTNYDKDKGKLTLSFRLEDKKNVNAEVDTPSFRFVGCDNNDIKEWLKLFNQPLDEANVAKWRKKFGGWNTELEFDNVWNRDTFYVHSSFSNSPRKVIGLNNDFWMNPSVCYQYNDNSGNFTIYFTTNTVNRILPRNGVLLIQLSFIYNWQNTIVM